MFHIFKILAIYKKKNKFFLKMKKSNHEKGVIQINEKIDNN